MSDDPQIPALPTYATSKHFIQRKQQGPLNKILSKMLKPKFHRVMKNAMRKTKKKHTVHFY